MGRKHGINNVIQFYTILINKFYISNLVIRFKHFEQVNAINQNQYNLHTTCTDQIQLGCTSILRRIKSSFYFVQVDYTHTLSLPHSHSLYPVHPFILSAKYLFKGRRREKKTRNFLCNTSTAIRIINSFAKKKPSLPNEQKPLFGTSDENIFHANKMNHTRTEL